MPSALVSLILALNRADMGRILRVLGKPGSGVETQEHGRPQHALSSWFSVWDGTLPT